VAASEQLSWLPRRSAGDITVDTLGDLSMLQSNAKMTIFLQMSLGWYLRWPFNIAAMIIMTMVVMSVVSALTSPVCSYLELLNY
jgi:hypothetical protein